MDLIYVVLWVLPSVLVGVGVGIRIGLGKSRHHHDESFDAERDKTLKVLQTVLQSTEQLTKDVDTHNADLETVERNVVSLQGTGQLEDIQNALLTQISTLLQSNQRLEDDLVCTHYQLEEQTQQLDLAHKEARMDELSGVPNRKSFNERLVYLLALHKRRQEPFALILADVDRFKWINDTYGHLAGDQVVSRIGAALTENLRETDFVGRYGGDESTLLVSDVDCRTAEKLPRKIA
jgi:diguanylate cyclase